MKISQPISNCYLFEFTTRKALTLSFCRIQEYFEASNPKLKGIPFTFYELINQMMKSDGTLDYFSFWDGFNFSGDVLLNWLDEIGDLTDHEKKLIDNIEFNGSKFYVIGCLIGDVGTIKHELAHAMYNLDDTYRNFMDHVYFSEFLRCGKQCDKMRAELKKLGYADEVLIDEIQAYLSTSPRKELRGDFDLDTDELKPVIKSYRKTFKKFYKSKTIPIKTE